MSEELAWYFAFGANMSPGVFFDRRHMRPVSSEAAILRGYRLVFDLRGVPVVEPAFASVRPDATSSVEGVLYRLPCNDLGRLRHHESPRYRVETLDVEGSHSGTVSATVYVNGTPVDGLIPSQRYMHLLIEGAEKNGLSAAWIASLRGQPTRHVRGVSTIIASSIGVLDRGAQLLRSMGKRDR